MILVKILTDSCDCLKAGVNQKGSAVSSPILPCKKWGASTSYVYSGWFYELTTVIAFRMELTTQAMLRTHMFYHLNRFDVAFMVDSLSRNIRGCLDYYRLSTYV